MFLLITQQNKLKCISDPKNTCGTGLCSSYADSRLKLFFLLLEIIKTENDYSVQKGPHQCYMGAAVNELRKTGIHLFFFFNKSILKSMF